MPFKIRAERYYLLLYRERTRVMTFKVKKRKKKEVGGGFEAVYREFIMQLAD